MHSYFIIKIKNFFQVSKDAHENISSDPPEAKRSPGVAAIWVARNRFAVLDKNQQVRYCKMSFLYHFGVPMLELYSAKPIFQKSG